ncbi:MAG: hypothetical protein GC168_01840 [Candidatus Hydrogenedens sp.]|nr:hypothetical protein [Candidatus Hydrogenedens sp.]
MTYEISTRLRWMAPLLIAVLIALPGLASAGTPRIMLMGDSWAWYMWLNRSFQQALQEEGLGEFEEIGNFTAIPGSTSFQWVDEKWLEQARKELEAHPTVDIVHLSIGGNGFLRGWHGGMPDAERDKLYGQIINNIETMIKAVQSVRPGIRVAICNYDYVNASRKSTVPELNQAGMVLAGLKRDLAKRMDNVEYIQNYGLMQNHFGIPGVAKPGEVPLPGQAPDFEPFPGGLKDYGNPPEAMLDNIHLSSEGYHVLAKHCIDVLYRKWLTEPAVSLPSLASADTAKDTATATR